MRKHAVYVHKRRDNGEVFYVGCCVRNDKMRANGVKKYKRAFDFGQRRLRWFAIVDSAGGVDVEIVFSSDDRGEAFKKEKELVDSYGRESFNNGLLVNECAGRDGAPGQPNSEMTKLKKSIRQRGRHNSMYGRRGCGLSRRVVDSRSGVIYRSVSEAAEQCGFKMKTLYNWLSGHRKNPTYLRFI